MLYKEIIAVCSEIQTRHINALCGKNAEFLNVKLGGTQCNQGVLRGKGLILQPSTQTKVYHPKCRGSKQEWSTMFPERTFKVTSSIAGQDTRLTNLKFLAVFVRHLRRESTSN
jgi:hypothetical protein